MGKERLAFFKRRELSANVGSKILDRREILGLSRRIVARRAGIDYRTLGRIERGPQKPTPDTLRRLAVALDTDVELLCNRWGKIEERRPKSGLACLGVGFRALRERKTITLSEAAKAAGISVSTLSRFECGIFLFPAR